MTKLLILSSDTGEGHNSAAAALQLAATEAGVAVSIRKPLEESGKLNRSMGKLYNSLLAHRPQWMTRYFWLIDRFRPNERDIFYSKAREFIAQFLDSEKPDSLLSVHPMLNHFVQRFIKEERRPIPCFTFLTDPFPPFWQGWASPYVDRYFVPTDEALQALTAMGTPAWKIEKVPMPVRPQFLPGTSWEIGNTRQSLHLEGSSTILINGGARGGGPIWTIYNTVRQAAPESNILVVCGHNALLQKRINDLHDYRTQTFGFLSDIHRYISAADLVLTKPGALSTYEALACGTPVLLLGVRGLMPQESGLFQAALHYEFGYAASRLKEVKDVILRGPQEWNRLRGSISHFYRSSSGRELIERIQPLHVRP
jgi:UDP-N-acetylglucosamine:LPS N-acetylglucosamine transferase